MPDHPPDHNLPRLAGRGAQTNPNNRFHPIHLHADYEQLEADDEFFEGLSKVSTEYFEDDSQSILSENNSPDIPFRYSLN
ncbi:MAG: hypothetical protein KDA51_01820, partial [Planctomycetales bacterium]|nr:hypothetical protein [Planctomycetales bacterium]